MKASEARCALKRLADPRKAKILRGFFKTGPGEYGEGDVFLGITVPVLRQVAKQYRDLSLSEIRKLIRSAIHEERLLALILMVNRFDRAAEPERGALFRCYLASTRFINNWDLVDLSAPNIVGAYLLERDRGILARLARSRNLWERRIAMVATHAFIRRKEFGDTFRVARILLRDRHDLIHKATGWMLREVGKRDAAAEEAFLRRHGRVMPRTMLRYAIERFPETCRRRYLRMTNRD